MQASGSAGGLQQLAHIADDDLAVDELQAVERRHGVRDWAHLPYEFMAKVSNEIINKVRGVNRVCYDISSKPPATIEWE